MSAARDVDARDWSFECRAADQRLADTLEDAADVVYALRDTIASAHVGFGADYDAWRVSRAGDTLLYAANTLRSVGLAAGMAQAEHRCDMFDDLAARLSHVLGDLATPGSVTELTTFVRGIGETVASWEKPPTVDHACKMLAKASPWHMRRAWGA